AEMLARLINASGTSYSASASGGVLTVTTTGAAFTAQGSSSGGFSLARTSAAASQLIALTGTPRHGESWSLSFDDGTPRTFVFTVPQLTATSEGAGLLIVNRIGTTFASDLAITPAKAYTVDSTAKSATVTLAGAPVAGEIWTLSLGTLAYAVTYGGAVDSLQKIAEGLAAAVNADTRTAAQPYTAVAEGATLVIVNRAGAAFTPSLQITSVSGFSLEAGTPKTLSGALLSTLNASDVWSFTLTLDVAAPVLATHRAD